MLSRRILRSFAAVKNFGVVGAGQMGTGIGIVANRVAGLNVTLIDNEAALQKAEGFVQKWIAKEQEKKRLTEEESKQIKSRFVYSKDISSLKNADFVVEVILETT